jgi:hypothetical protein
MDPLTNLRSTKQQLSDSLLQSYLELTDPVEMEKQRRKLARETMVEELEVDTGL